jgi:hypothetical protein
MKQQHSYTEDEEQHLNVLMEAFLLFRDRTGTRGDMWRQFPPSDKVRELRERVTRIETAFVAINRFPDHADGTWATIREDAIDIINYADFLIKQIDEGRDL